MKIICNSKSKLDLNYQSIKDKILRSKENLRRKNLANDPDSFLNKINLANDSYQFEAEEPEPSLKEEDGLKNEKFKSSISRAVRSIHSNMMNAKNIPVQTVEKVMSLLHDLTIESYKIKTAETASSIIYKTANKLKRDGIDFVTKDLEKLAQEITQEQQEVQPEQAQVEAQPAGQAPTAPDESTQEGEVQSQNETGIPKSDEVEPARFEDIETPGPEEGEYDGLIEDGININDASAKLDQVASMLADRRVIRNLAEFDIMLDKLGIASMFPELAESQSKLIDAFGYALTRVTKMMGQLSNAQTIMSSNESIPGADETPEG